MKMKKQILISLISVSSILTMNAQWTGTTTTSNVGVGTTTPSTKLEIVGSSQTGDELGTFKLKSSTIGQFMYIGYDDRYSAGYMQSVKPGTNQQNILLAPVGGNVGIGVNSPDRKLTVAGQIGVINGSVVFNNSGKLWDISSNGNSLAFNESGIQTPLFLQAGGNVGIATSSPSTKLEIVGSSQAGDELGTFKLKSSTAGQFMYIGYDDRYSAGFIQSVKPGSAQQNLLLAPNGGNIGVGTTSPAYKLDVCGTIRAKEVKVDLLGTCVPDFVFKSNYRLMDLKELEQFVKTNQHLPEIAPEKEMAENGVNMKEMQMKLLQKMEEMTLYIIEQNKKLEQQNEKITALENVVAEMKKK